MSRMPLEQYILADTPETLAEGLGLLEDLDTVGVDVERADWNRYFRAAALIQVGGDGRVALVDPVVLEDLAPLTSFLAARSTVLHALENDLGPLASSGVHPGATEDTAIAAAVLGLPTGLETLLRELLGVELDSDKSAMQRAEWEERPLLPEMLTYAAADVADLPALWAELEARLDASERTEWYRQELAATMGQPPAEERRDWAKVRGIGRLDPKARARVRHLWDVREELARSTDTAPSRIAGDKILVDLAVTPPRNRGELGRRGMRRAAIRDFGDALIAAVHADVEPERRSGPRPRPTTDEDRALAERLRALRAARAKELGIDAGVLCPSRTLMGAVMSDPTGPSELRDALELRPWQWQQLTDCFCEAFGFSPDGDAPDEEAVRGASAASATEDLDAVDEEEPAR
jgi:ribonuclease D